MRADKILMVGVVLLGGYAVYRLVTAPKVLPEPARPPTPPLPSKGEGGPPLGDASLPDAPGLIPAIASGTPLVSEPWTLQKERGYQGVIETFGQRSPFSTSSPREEIKRALEALGFADVLVLMTPSEARGHVPDWARDSAGRGTRWIHARWAAENRAVAKPAAFRMLWIARPPKVTT